MKPKNDVHGPGTAKAKKLKMSNTKFRVLLIIPMVIVALIAILVTFLSASFDGLLDRYLGRGKTHVQTQVERVDWDSNYYEIDAAKSGAQGGE